MGHVGLGLALTQIGKNFKNLLLDMCAALLVAETDYP